MFRIVRTSVARDLWQLEREVLALSSQLKSARLDLAAEVKAKQSVMAELHTAREELRVTQDKLDLAEKALAKLRAENRRAAQRRNEKKKERRA